MGEIINLITDLHELLDLYLQRVCTGTYSECAYFGEKDKNCREMANPRVCGKVAEK